MNGAIRLVMEYLEGEAIRLSNPTSFVSRLPWPVPPGTAAHTRSNLSP